MDFAYTEPCWTDIQPVLVNPSKKIAQQLALGCIIGVAYLEMIAQFDGVGHVQGWHISERERLYGDFSAGRYGLWLTHCWRLPRPIPCKGALGLWRLPDDIHTTLDRFIGLMSAEEMRRRASK